MGSPRHKWAYLPLNVDETELRKLFLERNFTSLSSSRGHLETVALSEFRYRELENLLPLLSYHHSTRLLITYMAHVTYEPN